MKKEDFDLGASLLDADDPSHAELRRQILAAQHERNSRQQRLRNVKRTLAGVVALAIVALVAGMLKINSEKDRAVAAEQTATNAKNNAIAAREQERAAKTQAEKDRAAAVQSAEKEVAAKKLAQENERKATEKENQANVAKRIAMEERDKAEYQRYIATIGLAASKIDENSFDTAEDLLKNSPNFIATGSGAG